MGYAALPEIKLYKQYSQSQPVCDFFVKLKEYIDTAYYQGLINGELERLPTWSEAAANNLELADTDILSWAAKLAADKYGIDLSSVKSAGLSLTWDVAITDIGTIWDAAKNEKVTGIGYEHQKIIALELIIQAVNSRRWTVEYLLRFIAKIAGCSPFDVDVTPTGRGFDVHVNAAVDYNIDGVFAYFSDVVGLPYGMAVNITYEQGGDYGTNPDLPLSEWDSIITHSGQLNDLHYSPHGNVLIMRNETTPSDADKDGEYIYIQNEENSAPSNGNWWIYEASLTTHVNNLYMSGITWGAKNYHGIPSDSNRRKRLTFKYYYGRVYGSSTGTVFYGYASSGTQIAVNIKNFPNEAVVENIDFVFEAMYQEDYNRTENIITTQRPSLFDAFGDWCEIKFKNCTFSGSVPFDTFNNANGGGWFSFSQNLYSIYTFENCECDIYGLFTMGCAEGKIANKSGLVPEYIPPTVE